MDKSGSQQSTNQSQQGATNYAQQAASRKLSPQQKQKPNQQNLKQNQLKQNQLKQNQLKQTQLKSDQPSNILQKIKHNFILILVNFGFLFLILVANILVFLRIFSDLKTIKLDLLEIQSRGEALQQNLKPLEAAISSLGIGKTTPSPTTPPIQS